MVTRENYYSKLAEQEYLSCSQYYRFMECEAAAMAMLTGEYAEEPTREMLVGRYVHAQVEGVEARDAFIAERPDMFTKQGTLRSEYSKADDMVARLVSDPLMQRVLIGEKEKVFTGMIGNHPWKIRVDVWNPEYYRFTDVKTTRSINERVWRSGRYIPFFDEYNYPARFAVYASIIAQNQQGNTEARWPRGYIAAVSKEDPPDIAVISIIDTADDNIIGFAELYNQIKEVEENQTRIILLKTGALRPVRCEACAYCRKTKVLSGAVHYSTFY